MTPPRRNSTSWRRCCLQSGDSDQETEAVFADLLAVPAGERYPPLPDDPRQKRERIFAALVRQLEDLAQHRPVLFLFEDAHWIDSTSLDLLDRIAERVRRLPVLMVVTFRPEFEPPWTGQAQVTSLTLSRLGQRETKALVGRVAGGKTLPVEILDRIIEHTDGIPLCIEELTKTLLEGTLLREENGQYILSGPLPTLAIPSSLHDSLMARLDRLGPVKEVAQIGAAIGREFSYDIVKAVANRPDDQLARRVEPVGRGWIDLPPRRAATRRRLSSSMPSSRTPPMATLLRGRRQELHAGIAKVLEEQVVPPLGEDGVGRRGRGASGPSLAQSRGVGKGTQLHAGSGRTGAEALCASRGDQPLLASPRVDGAPATYCRTAVDVHCDVILSLVRLPGSTRNEEAEARLFRHVDQALTNATEAGQTATMARLESIKGRYQDDKALLESAIVRAESSGDRLAEAFTAANYGGYLGDTRAI